MQRAYRAGLAAIVLAFAACGDDAPATCDPVGQTGCDTGLVCEEVEGGSPACLAPVVMVGDVFDLTDDSAVGGAHVVALDANGSPVSTVAVSDGEGHYTLAIPSTRASDGTPAGRQVTLRADAANYQTFPAGLRQALPVDTGAATKANDGRWVLDTAQTDVGLLPLPAGTGTGRIHGKVEVPADHAGMLVVAEAGGVGTSAVADRDGDYTIFNLDAGSYTVTAYALGVNYDPGTVELAAGGDAQVDLAINDVAPGTVTGTVQIVDAPGGSTTSVILTVESTFNENLARGEMPAGLRAADVSGAYTIENVPAGRYVVLAAFENDGLVRDPDESIGGTVILHISVTGGQTTTVDGFKVTGALTILGPGAGAPEAVSGTPTFSWVDDSSEDEYDLQLFDSYGEQVGDTIVIPGVSGSDPSVEWPADHPALEPGMYYQFRVTSSKDQTPISRTEDLRGVFWIE